MKKLFVRDIMAPCVSTLHKDDSFLTFVKSLRDTQLDAIPVVDSKGKIVGIMTKARLYDALIAGNRLETPITNFFTSDIHKFSENMLYDDAADIVRGCRAGSAIVMDDQEQLLGIVSKSDWIMAMFKNEGRLRNQLQAIYDSMHNGLIAINCDRRIMMANVSAENILGIEASKLYEQSINDLFPDLDFDPIIKDKKNILGKNIHRNTKSYLCNISPLVDDSSKSLNDIIGAIVVFQDMTDVERAFSNLTFVTKINNTLQSILDIVYDGIVTVNENANITMVNRSMEKFLNLSSQEIVGMPVTKFIKNSSLPRVIKTGKPEMNTLHILEGKPYVISGMPIVSNNKVIGAVGTIVFANLETIKALALKLEERNREAEYFKKIATRDQACRIHFEDIITANPKMIRAKEDAKIASTSNLSILLIGESGTGKELFAQSIHNESRRKGKLLINVNCAAIPESLLESEFFGYASGAFSGAQQKGRSGKFTMADEGTLFLDEIGDMGLALQSKLLRVIEDGSFEPLGSNLTIRVNTRIIAATNKNIEKMVEKGTFRSDLYFRLNTVQIYIPSLIERPEDIMLLFDHFLKKYNTVFGTDIKGCSPEVKNILSNHTWPGNVREIKHVVERAINYTKNDIIEEQALPLYLTDKTHRRYNMSETFQPNNSLLRQQRSGSEKKIIQGALEQANGNKAKAAKLLGISRSLLYQKMNSWSPSDR